MREILEQILLDDLQKNSPDSRAERLHFFMESHNNWNPNAKTYMFAIPEGKATPAYYVKIAKQPSGKAYLENSAYSLDLINQRSNLSNLRDSFPRNVFCGKIVGNFVQIETFLRGVNLSSRILNKKEKQEFLGKVISLLAEFQVLTAESVKLDRERLDKFFLKPVEEAMQYFSSYSWLMKYLSKFKERVYDLKGRFFPLTFAHNSLATHNVKVNGDKVGFIDWELSQYPGLPLIDLLHLLITNNEVIYGENYYQAFLRLFSEAHAKELSAFIESYSRKLQLDSVFLEILIIQHFVLRLLWVVSYREEVLRCLQALYEKRIHLD